MEKKLELVGELEKESNLLLVSGSSKYHNHQSPPGNSEINRRRQEQKQKIEEMVLKKLKLHLKSKIESSWDDPMKVVQKHKLSNELNGNVVKPFVSAVEIRIVSETTS